MIRKDGRVGASCNVRPLEANGRISYVFTVASDFVSESDFFLSEGRWEDLTIDGGDEKKETMKVAVGDSRFRFALRDFVTSDDASH